MTLKHPLIAGVSRSMFAQPLSSPLMLRGPMVPFSPEDEGAAAEAPVVEAPETPVAEAPEAAAAAEAAETPEEAAAEAPESPEPAAEEPRKPKSPVAQLQGRVGHLTKVAHQKDETIADQQRQLEAYQRLLAAQGIPVEGPDPAAPHPTAAPAPGTPEFDRLVDERATQKAAQARFTADCNAIFDDGIAKHGDTFKESLANLNVLGLMNEQVVDAALATGAAADILNFLGSDVDEAARITALPPVRMAVELTKVAAKLVEPKPQGQQISRAPAPIAPIGGQGTTVEPDIYDKRLNSGDKVSPEYAARRAAMGASWAKPAKPTWGT